MPLHVLVVDAGCLHLLHGGNKSVAFHARERLLILANGHTASLDQGFVVSLIPSSLSFSSGPFLDIRRWPFPDPGEFGTFGKAGEAKQSPCSSWWRLPGCVRPR